MNKIITLASFVLNEKISSFKSYLKKRFNIEEKDIFEYSFDDEEKTILTYRIFLEDGERVDTKSFFPTTIIVHKKGDCFYTINALNKLIESIHNLEKGNINYRDYEIDWNDYQNKFIIVKYKELKIIDIKRIFS